MTALPRKIAWLVSHPDFKRAPLRVGWRALYWELCCILKKSVRYRFDRDHPVVLCPREGASRLTYYFGTSEPATFRFMEAYLKPGMRVIDVGANIGLNAIFAARRVEPGGCVFAFEPDPENYRRVLENMRGISGDALRVVNAACGSAATSKVILHHDDHDSSRSFVEVESVAVGSGEIAQNHEVAVVSLDDFVIDEDITRIDYLKIDVEGFEMYVLEGAKRLLEDQVALVIQLEVDDEALRRNGSTADQLTQRFEDAGYVRCSWDDVDSRFHAAHQVVDYNSFFVGGKHIEYLQEEGFFVRS